RVYVDDQVVLGDHRLRAGAENLFPQIELAVHPVHPWDDEVQPGGERAYITTEAFDVVRPRLRNDPNRRKSDRDQDDCENDEGRSEEHTSELQSRFDLVCRLLLEKKKKQKYIMNSNVVIRLIKLL